MADDTHNHIEGDFVIKNTDGVEEDYSFVGNRYSGGDDVPIKMPMVLFRLLVPGPSNLRGRSEAYQVTISTR
tara:strand:- start:519 stop:734 length:216 start_codon:yes stop_codon:yes gene_type:complete